MLLPARALIDGVDTQSGIEESLFPHTGMENIVIVYGGVGEHLRIRLKGDHGAVLIGIPHHGDGLGDLPSGKLHLIDLAVLVNLDLQPLRQGVYHAGAHAVQAAGDLVAPAAKLTARVEDGKHDLQRGKSGLGLYVHRDAAAVVGDGNDVALFDDHIDLIAVTGQSLVDGIVYDLIHQMMETGGRGGTDIHAGPLADGL